MKKMRFIPVIVLTALIALIGCKDETPEPTDMTTVQVKVKGKASITLTAKGERMQVDSLGTVEIENFDLLNDQLILNVLSKEGETHSARIFMRLPYYLVYESNDATSSYYRFRE